MVMIKAVFERNKMHLKDVSEHKNIENTQKLPEGRNRVKCYFVQLPNYSSMLSY
jgi:hypothetical protein